MKKAIIIGVIMIIIFSLIMFIDEQIKKENCYDLPISETYKHSECDKYWGN